MSNKINITRREFQVSSKNHYSLYKSTTGSENTRRLILFYAVECGLKSLIMKAIGKDTYDQFELYCEETGKKEIKGHNIKAMLKELDYGDAGALKAIELDRGGSVDSKKYNELWRYGAAVKDTDAEAKIEKALGKIAEWIHSR